MCARSLSPENDIFSLEIVPDRENKPVGTTSTDFDGFLPRPLQLYEDLKDGCGGMLWPAGMTLSKYMLKYRHDLRGKSVLEIGAGGGLVGLAVASGCLIDTKVIITDQVPMLSLMQKNIELNSCHSKVQAEVYDWGSPVPDAVTTIMDAKPCPDVLLAADCVYFEPAFPLLLQALIDLIGSTTACYFCFKKRRKADLRFIRDMNKTFTVEQVDYEGSEDDRRNTIFLYKLTKKEAKLTRPSSAQKQSKSKGYLQGRLLAHEMVRRSARINSNPKEPVMPTQATVAPINRPAVNPLASLAPEIRTNIYRNLFRGARVAAAPVRGNGKPLIIPPRVNIAAVFCDGRPGLLFASKAIMVEVQEHLIEYSKVYLRAEDLEEYASEVERRVPPLPETHFKLFRTNFSVSLTNASHLCVNSNDAPRLMPLQSRLTSLATMDVVRKVVWRECVFPHSIREAKDINEHSVGTFIDKAIQLFEKNIQSSTKLTSPVYATDRSFAVHFTAVFDELFHVSPSAPGWNIARRRPGHPEDDKKLKKRAIMTIDWDTKRIVGAEFRSADNDSFVNSLEFGCRFYSAMR